MEPVIGINGHDLREMFSSATSWLEKRASDIDALNVFPVPDGDTGTNMLLTMQSSIEEAYRTPDHSLSQVIQAMAKGALMGARGNSGVILSQICHGLAKTLTDKQVMQGHDLAEALQEASKTAYKGCSEPVEGTILTVIREAASAAQRQTTEGDNDILSVLKAAVNAAYQSVANTPALLPILREAGVVDAGGQGLYTLLEGTLIYLRGDAQLIESGKPEMVTSSIPLTSRRIQMITDEEEPFGYCTEFLLKGDKLDPDELRKTLIGKGQSLIVVGDESTVRVHVHTQDADSIINYANSLGQLENVSIRNMDEQHENFLVLQRGIVTPVYMDIVAVVAGDGLADFFTSLGVSAIVPGGQTMNPSTKDILQAVDNVPSDRVIILPNNKNVVLSAQQVDLLTSKSVRVVPTETIAQGVTALVAFNPEDDFETNAKAMNEAKSTVKTIEITRATHSTHIRGLDIKQGQAIGLLDSVLLASGDKPSDVIFNLLSRIDLSEASVITIYYGADTNETKAKKISADIGQQYPAIDITVNYGGQPHYNYIISVE